jgi:hypothetical protein
MGRAIVGVIAGYAVWTALWLGGNSLLFGRAGEVVASGQKFTAVGLLLGILALSVVCSLAAGAAAAAIAKARTRGAVMVMGTLLLATGIAVQASVWNLMPVWYHVPFLVLVVPACILGARLVSGGRAG